MTPEPTTIGVILLAVTSLLEFLRRWQKDKSDGVKAAAALLAEEKHRQWEREDRAAKQSEMLGKLDANTDISVQAFAAANSVDVKFTSVAKLAEGLSDLRNAVTAMQANIEEIRHLVELRLGAKLTPGE